MPIMRRQMTFPVNPSHSNPSIGLRLTTCKVITISVSISSTILSFLILSFNNKGIISQPWNRFPCFLSLILTNLSLVWSYFLIILFSFFQDSLLLTRFKTKPVFTSFTSILTNCRKNRDLEIIRYYYDNIIKYNLNLKMGIRN